MNDEAPKKKIPMNFLKSPQSRIFLTVALVIVVVIGVALLIHWHNVKVASEGAVSVSGVPAIHSVPGAGSPSAAYVKAQMHQNIAGEESAEKSATAFVPTITRAGFIGNPSEFGAESAQPGKHCQINKVVVAYRPNPESCTPKNLQLARETGVTVEELMCQGCACPALKAAGYTIGDLKKVGMTAAQLHQCGFDLQQLKDAGFSAADLKDAGFTAGQLKSAGFSAAELKNAGFSAAQLKNAGFSAAQLKNAGFTASELKDAGFTAGQLASAGYSAKELRAAGFSAAALRKAGVNASELHAAGVAPSELAQAGYSKGDIIRGGYKPAAVGYPEAPQPTEAASGLPPIGETPTEAKLAQFEKDQQASMSAQQRADHIHRMEAAMNQMAQKLMTAWSNNTTQQFQKAPPETNKGGANGNSNGNGSSGSLPTPGSGNTGPIFKAGSILFGVIETSINSDVNTPIMAKIVAGPLNGSKLMGTFVRQHKSLLINFTVLSDPAYPHSMAINAVAIDPDTARTALSGDVDSHYLLRYGSLFASSFVQGISQAIMNNGVSSDCLFGGFGCTLKQTPLNSQQQIYVGLGQMGQAYSQHMGNNFNMPPTVRIPAGTGVGVLLMGDLTLPKPIPMNRVDNEYDNDQ